MIKPSIGRVVWYHPPATERIKGEPNDQDRAALVTYVWGDRMVNLMATTPNGVPYGVTSVTLVQDGDPTPTDRYATWMPYQKGQAAKAEALEKQVKGAA
jgi:hypothetical protein